MIDGGNSFDQPIRNNIKTYENSRKVVTGQRDYFTASCLLDYPYFNENYKLVAIYLSKQKALDADPKAIQQINFTENFWIFGGSKKKNISDFSQGEVRVL